MKSFGVILMIICSIAASMAAVALQPNATHSEHPGKCYHEESKTALSPGEAKSLPGRCIEITCLENYALYFKSCGVYLLDDPSCEEIGMDLSKHYPECCKKYKCIINGKVTYS
ncbi:uncharacterized protein LOC131690538 [Topomyia yanbarensis]|uniref:uncharacterized protein LOC131690538 n=1 Tax=Topomyia yanbarensis TaxID=2498891 RepID=UPI00273CB936|nr:uncharacterized protein LOC131690538 [Topomyia yanbarensis]